MMTISWSASGLKSGTRPALISFETSTITASVFSASMILYGLPCTDTLNCIVNSLERAAVEGATADSGARVNPRRGACAGHLQDRRSSRLG